MLARVGELVPWRAVVVPWLVSRLVCAGVILGAASWPFDAGLEFRGFQIWDGAFYTSIARGGYGALPMGDLQTRFPFFPLMPGLMRGLREIGLGDQASIVILNQLVLLLAFAGVFTIARRHASPRAAALAVWALAVFPGSFVFTMIYPSSIFLAATVWAFVFVEDRKDWAAAAMVVVASLARPNGILLVVALVVALRSWRRITVVCTPAVIAVVGWCAWLGDRTGDPLVFWNAKSAWPEVSVLDLATAPLRYDYAWPHFLLGLAAAGVVWHQRKRLPTSWLAWTAIVLVPPLLVGVVGLGRYANECFPPFVAAGQILERWSPWARRLTFALSVLGLLFAAVMVIRFDRIP
ncbi:MAG: glycosyltransferase family 39 protein [Acidimicrobiia bacterium]